MKCFLRRSFATKQVGESRCKKREAARKEETVL